MNVRVTIAELRGLVHDMIKSAKQLLDDMLLFGMNRPCITLKSLEDMMTKEECDFSIMREPLNRLGKGYRLMLSLMKLVTSDKKTAER